MTIAELLAQLHEKNVTLSVSGDELVVLGRSQIFESPSLLNLLRENKKAIVELIKTGKYVGSKENGNNIPPNIIPSDCKAITPEMLPLTQLTSDDIARIVSKAPGGAANVQDIYPLAPLQEGILFHYLLKTEGDPYLGQVLYSFDSRSQLDSFLQALQSVIDRHDILRTAVVWEGLTEPVQVVWRRAPIIMEEISFDPGAGDVTKQLRARLDPRHYQLDISQAPMMRVYIAPAGHDEDALDDRWLMSILYQHLAVDHITVDIMVQEVHAHLLGRADQLPAPAPFRDFVARARLGVSREEHEAFFRKMLGDVEEPTAPFGLLDVQEDGSSIEKAVIDLEPALERRLRNRARALGVSMASVCHLAWARVLARVSGRDDVVFGTVLFGRMQEEERADRAMGLFINTLPARIGIGDEGVGRSVRKAHELLTDLMKHEHASLALAQRCSGVAAPTPLFSSLFNYRHITPGVATSPEAASVWTGIKQLKVVERTNYPLTLSVNDFGNALGLTAQVVTGLNPGRVCDYMRTALEGLVEALESEPERAVREIEVVPEAERRQVVEEWNATETDYPREKLIHELFEEQVERTPEAMALVYEELNLTYGELNLRANRLARRLRGLGVGPEARVAICLERSLEMVVALLAILKAGAAYVPLDPDCPPERLAYMLGESRPLAVLTEDRVKAEIRVALSGSGMPVINLAPNAADDESRVNEAETNLNLANIGVTSEHLAYVIYTSGSTGAPKGVMARHGSVTNLITALHQAIYRNYETPLRVSINAPLFFDASVKQLVQLSCGHSLYIVPEELRVDAGAFLSFIARREIEVLDCTPSQLRLLLEAGLGKQRALKLALVGGEAINGALWDELAESAGTTYFNVYGPTECTVDTSICQALPELSRPTVGRPIANVETYIVDAHMRPVPVEVSGELYIGGDGLARGYLNRADLTAERFLPNPHGSRIGARLYRTGDLARWRADGNLEFLGRTDRQMKIRGFRIELGEIEARLIGHPEVREAIVAPREEEEGGKRLVAYYTGEKVGAEELRAHLSSSLPDYMTPAAYVHLESLPLTPNGKLDRRALPAPEGEAYVRRGYEAPEGETERKLAQIWAETLKLERVGRHDNFFELGGHSLLAITVIERMRREGMQADVRTLFTAPALRALAEAVRGRGENEAETPPNLIPAGCQRITPEMLPLIELTQEEIDAVAAITPGGAANIQDIYPLTALQEGILFHHLMESEGDVYLTPALLSLDSRERVEKFVQALQAVISRHDVLRTAVVWEGLPEPAQVVWREAPLSVEEVSLDPQEGEIGRQLLARFNPRRYRLDVRQAPLMRGFAAYDAAGERWLLLWLKHHLMTDHTTLEIMTREAQAHLSGEAERLPEPMPFRNFVAQARLGAGGIGREGHEAFFREMLGDVDEPTAPFGLTDARGDGSGIEEARLKLEMGLSGRLRERARMLGVSPASLCHLAWALVLARVSGRDDVVFGTVLFGRMQGGEGADRAPGLFMNTLPIRIRVDEEGVERSAKRAHRLLAELIAHERASLALAQRCSGVEAPAPLFSSLLNYRHSPRGTEAAEAETARAWTGVSILASEERSNYPVALSIDDLGDGFALTAQTVTQIEPWRVCGYMRRALEGLVEALEVAPERAVREIDAQPEAERRQVVVEWNATETDYPREKLIHELFEEQVERSPEAVALVKEEQSLTYGELNLRANRLAHHLRVLGVGPEARVAICLERSLEMVVALLATLKAGGAYAPLDPAYPSERLAYMLEDSAPAVLLTHGAARSALSAHILGVCAVDLDTDAPQWAGHSKANPGRAGLNAHCLAYVIYTSGSTGAPKGVMVEHQGLCNLVDAQKEIFGLGAGARVLQFASLSFDASVWEIFSALAAGVSLYVYGRESLRPGDDLVRALREDQITTVTLAPSVLAAMGEEELINLETVIAAGEASTTEIVERWARGRRFFDAYGPTEATVCASIGECKAGGGGRPSIGRPIKNTRLYILDGRMNPAPVWVQGELYIAGVGLARGYQGKPEQTAERFIPDLFSAEGGGRLYRTGDVVRHLKNGELEFIGRADDQVKVRGYRIELGEIEARLAEYSGTQEVVVIAEENGDEGKRLVAYYTGEKVGAEELRAHLSSSLPDYMTPAAYVHLESLPLTPNGKLDRRALPAPEGEAYVRRGYEAPVGEAERKLAQIWAETLKLERVGRRDNFFELGGHSLLALTVIERMRREGMQADVRTLFTAPTLRALAEAVRGRGENEAETPPNLIPAGCQRITPEMLPLIELTQQEIDAVAAITPGGAANIRDIYPLTALQEGILFHHLMESEGDVYLTPALLSLDSRERVEKFVQALQAVISRHDVLRTAVVWEGLPEPAQVVWREAPLSVEEVSLDPEEGEIGRQLLARFNPRRYRLDVRQAPLMRGFAAYDAVGERWLLLWLNHHLTIDHTTLEIMTREAQAHLSGEAERLPEPMPFRNFVAQARLGAGGIGREEHEAFFREMLGDVDEPTAPFGLTDARGDGSGIEEARLKLEMGLSGRLRERARKLGVSAASLCHLAWALVLARVSGRDDVVFGTVLFGRMQGGEGADRAPGLFINTLPIRIRVDEEGVERSAKRAHRLLAELIAHEHASLALAQRLSGVEAPAPLFSSLLNYRHSPRGTEAAEAETARAWTGVSILASEERTNYPVGLSIDDLGEGFALTAQTVTQIEPWRVCGYMRTALEGLVNALEAAPETAMRAIDALPEAERRQVVEEWNATEADYPREKLIHELFEEQAERSPHAVALICEEQSLTYGELNLRANRLAHYLRVLGIGPEARVAICLERSLEMVVALLATLKAGGAYAPLDPAYPSERLAYMLEDSAPVALLTHGAARSALDGRLPAIPILDIEGDETQWVGLSEQNPGQGVAGSDARSLAYIIYTSGSTGAPKGVMIEHQGLCNLVEAQKEIFGLGAGARVLQFASLSFDASVSEIFSTLAAGGSLHVYGRESLRPGDDLVRALREDQITTVTLAPSVLAAMGEEELINLETVIAAGEASTTEIVERWARGRKFLDAYGPTEATVCASIGECKAGGGGRPSIGRPIKNTRLYILDGQMNPAPVWVQGELYIAGVGLARGYQGKPEQTAERFIPDLFSAEGGGRLYRTGDVVRHLKNGELEFIGRADDQVKVRGYRIELGEIGAVLNEHGSVKQSVVVAREDERGDKRLIGYVVGEAGARSAELKRYVRERLPEYMVPDAIVLLEEMPLTANGKIDWKRLPSVFSLKDAGRQVEQEYVASRAPLEEMVVGIFEEVLKLDRVGIHDNFFEIGGHSLSAIQVMSRIRSAFEVEIGVRSVFEEPTAEGLSRKIEETMRAGEKAPAPPLVRVEREGARGGRFPLSFAQQRLWFLEQLDPGSPLYNIPGAVRLEGALNLDALERSVNEIVRRHEVLRTRIEIEAGEPAQVIDEWEPRRLEVEDLTSLNPEEREAEVSRRARAEAEMGFDLSEGPLLRVKLIKLEEERYALLYTMHHIVSDGWSMGILTSEIGALYRAYSMGGAGYESPLEEAPIQYADFAVWQRAWLQGEALERELEYWLGQLAGVEDLKLPTDRPRPAAPSYRGAIRRFVVESDLAKRLGAMGRRKGVTLFMALLAGFDVLMSRYSGQEDVVIGTDVANRNRTEIEGLIGFFVNQLALRAEVRAEESFSLLLKRVREACLGAYAHQDLPFEKLVEELQPERDPSRSPLFQVKLVMQNAPGGEFELEGLRLSGDGGEIQTADGAQTAKFDLTVSITDGGQALFGLVEYSRDLFEDTTIERLISHYTNVLSGIAEDGERPISQLDLLSCQEREQIVVEWNQTGRPYPRDRRIHELIQKQVELAPEKIALVGDGKMMMSYGELNRRADQLGRYLQRLGVGPEVVVGLCLERSVEMVVGLLGALKAGGAYLPLDPESPLERLSYVMEDAGVGVALTVRELEGRLPAFLGQTVCLDEEWEKISEEGENEPQSEAVAGNLAYVIYTSGSTGKPKGVAVHHQALVARTVALVESYELTSADRLLQFVSPSFDAFAEEVFPTLSCGSSLAVDQSVVSYTANDFFDMVERLSITILHTTQIYWRQLVDELSINGGRVSNQLRLFISGGESPSAEALRKWSELAPQQTGFVNAYGPTEATITSTVYRTRTGSDRTSLQTRAPIGRPIANTQVYILDSNQELIPVGVKGELYIAGAGVTRGYLGRPELTAERFIPNLFGGEGGGRLYRTGDLCRYLPDGEIEFVGRVDDQVKVRGYRIELGEIEAVLNEHGSVKQSVAVAREDERGDRRLVGYVVGEEGVTSAELNRYVRERLPEYMAPSVIVVLEQMPLTPNGKLNRQALPAPEGGGIAREYEAPVGATETVLAQIWAETLKLERVGRHDNFFELGGHSLLAVTMIERMRREGMQADVRTLFTAPTLRALAEAIRSSGGSEAETPPNLIPAGCRRITPEMLPLIELTQQEIDAVAAMTPGGAANIQDIYPLTVLQEGILFHHLMSAEGDAYLLSILLAFDTRERLDGFVGAVQSVVSRHDILRTAVVWEGLPEPAQVVWREALLGVEEVRLDPKEGETGRQLLARFNPRRYRLDVRQAPLMRGFAAYDAAGERWLLLWLSHHLTIDHIAMEIMTREAQAHLSGDAEGLPEPLPFRNFVAQARLGAGGIGREEHEAFFREMLGDVDEPTAPFGLTDAQGDGSGIEEARLKLEMGLSGRLRERARMLGVSAASLCHLAWALVLARVSGRDDVVFGTVLFGRMQGGAGADRTPGLFINTLPIRIRVDEEGVERSAKRAHRLLAELIAHERASLALAQRLSRVEAPAPLFSALLNYRHSSRGTEAEEAETDRAWTGVSVLALEERTNYPVALAIDDLGEGFALAAQTVTQIEPWRVCDYMRTALEGLVEALESEPERAVREIEVMPEAERRQVVEEWNATETDYPREKCVHELFEAQVEKSPEAVAMAYEDEQVSYGELNARANRLARRLWELGVRPGARVAIVLERSIDLALSELAILKCGAAYAPLDQNAPAARQAFMIEDCQAEIVLADRDLEVAARAKVIRVDIEALRPGEESLHNLRIPLDSETAAYVIYTSGSTGQPKGVVVPHRAIGRLALNNGYAAFEANDRVAFTSNPAFDASTMEVWAPLLHGGCVVVIPEGVLLRPNALADLLHQEEVNILHLVAGLMSAYADLLADIFPRLRYLLTGGDAVDPRAIARVLGGSPPQHLIHCYGPSESTTFATTHEVAEVGERARSIPIGRPIANTQIYLLDSHGQPAPIGVAGEIYIGGAGVASGYLDRAELTAERFLPDPFGQEAGARIYKTGDLGRWLPEGRVEFLGRNDHQVKIRGFRVEVGEIEAQLGSHPAVRQCVVVAHQDEGVEKRLVAYYTGEKMGAEELRAHLSSSLPDYMTPAAYVHLERLPLAPNGKLDRQALPAPQRNVAPENFGALPRTAIEEMVVGIFEKALKLERVGIYDNFFEIGGHSLLATQVASRIRSVFGVEIGVRSVFEEPTVEDLSRRIEVAIKACEEIEAPPLVRVSREGKLPLSFAQQRLWFIDRLNPGSALYNIPGAVRLEGALNLEALEYSVNEIVRRHEVLRTRIEVEAGEPAQVIDEWEPRRLEVEDLTSLNPEEREAEVSRRARAEAETGFDLSKGPLLRVKLLKLEEERYALLYTMHHIVSDGWSMGILTSEIGALYRAYSMGGAGYESPLEEAPIQYADFAVWQRGWLQNKALAAELEYWRKQLAGMEALELPTDHPRPAAPSYRGGSRGFVIGSDLAERLRALGRREEVTLFMTLLAGFDVLMSRYSGQREVALGTDIANRNRAEIEGLIGFFVNQLVMRVEVRPGERFSELLKRVREVCLGAYAHQDVPFEKLVEELQPERDLSRSPLFQVKLILQNAPVERLDLEGVGLARGGVGEVRQASQEQPARLDLTVSIIDDGYHLVGAVSYSRDLFEDETIEGLMRHYTNVLRGVVEDGERPISELSLLSDEEREQIVVEWNETWRPYPNGQCVHEMIVEQVERNPERVALIYEGQQVSYGELNRRVNQLGNYLKGLGVGPEMVVGVCLERSVEMVVALLGALKAGGAYLPLDAASPLERTGYMLEEAGVGVVLTERKLEERLPAFLGQTVLLDEEWGRIAEESESKQKNGPERVAEDRLESEVEAVNLAYVIYTSGSSGRPKGVMITHGGLANYLRWASEAYGMEEGEGATVNSSIGFDLTVTSLYLPLINGKSVNLLPEEEGVEGLARALSDERGYSLVKITPAHLEVLEKQLGEREVKGGARALVIGGEELRAERLKYWRERASGTRLINEYGPTETVVGCCVYEVNGSEDGREAVPIGRPIANTRVYILNRELNPAPAKVRGELHIAGEGVARGYLGKPELTAERFIPNPFGGEGGERVYRTGDVVRYLSDGNIEFMGRVDDQVKVRGYRIELGEIEARLSGYPEVRETVVLAREEGEGDKKLVAYYTGREIGAGSLRTHLAGVLPDYMIPAAYVHLERLPLTPNGKLDRRALPAPEGEAYVRRGYEAPEGERERKLAQIWAETLKLERVGRHENFFELGGHSLLAVTLVERMRRAGLQVDVRALFTTPTIAELALCAGSSESLIEIPPNLIPNINTDLLDSSENVQQFSV